MKIISNKVDMLWEPILAKWMTSALNPACSGTRRVSIQSDRNEPWIDPTRFRQSKKGSGKKPVKLSIRSFLDYLIFRMMLFRVSC
jgi:hypothetical protein